MRTRLVLALLLAVAVPASAQIAPPQKPGTSMTSFSFFHCLCSTTVGGPLPNQFSFAPPVPRTWDGSVYAVSANEAVSKAQLACTADRRGSLYDCINCRCNN